ncbi:TPA: hypothetical protein U1D09_002180 [Streptococcus suis]|nr:hypothetical protein [Streptococcus suis]
MSQELDLRVPTHLTLKELLQIVSEAYNLGFELINPSARDQRKLSSLID